MIYPLALCAAFVPLAQTPDVRGPEPLHPHQDDIKTPGVPASAERAADPDRSLAQDPAQTWVLESARLGVAQRFERIHVDRPSGQVPGADWWVRGANYKARFGADRIEFIPFLGSDAPRNMPLGLDLASIEVGGELVAFEDGLDAVHGEDAMTYKRGPITERYLLDTTGIEQTFVFDVPFEGEARVTVAFDTDLVLAEAESGLRFESARGGVTVGGAVAIDARGRRTALDMEVAAGRYTMVIPAAFVRSAAFPLTIDPIISTFTVDDFSVRQLSPKAAYDEGTNQYLVVYSEDFSATDGDVFSSSVQPDGTVLNLGYVDISADRWTLPDVGNARLDGTWLVAAPREIAGAFEIVGRMMDATTLVYDPVFQIDTGRGGEKRGLSVGGETLDRFLVVWEREFTPTDRDVHARIVRSNQSFVGTSEILLDNSTVDYRRPACSKFGGAINASTSAWAVVAERDDGTATVIDGARVLWDGSTVQAFVELYSSTEDSLFPRVSSPLEKTGEQVYMVTWERDFGTDVDIFAAIFSGAGASAVVDLSIAGLAGATAFDDEFLPRVESNGRRFTLAWRDGVLGAPDATYISTVILIEDRLCVAENRVLDDTGWLDPSGLASSTLPANDPDVLVVSEDEDPALSDENIEGAIYDDFARCLGLSYCGSAINSSGVNAEIYADGSGDAGDFHALYATRLPANQFVLFLCSRTEGFVSNPAGSEGNLCLGGDIGRFNTQIVNAGSDGSAAIVADTSLLPLNVNRVVMPGDTIRFQAWFRDDVGSGPTSNYTDGQVVTFN